MNLRVRATNFLRSGNFHSIWLVWSRSGVHTGSPDANGNVAFTTNALSKGIHQITLRAEDADGYTASASIEVSTMSPSAITLLEPGMMLDGGGDMDDERLRKIPNTNEYISITEGVIPTDMNYYKLDYSGNFVQHHNDIYHGDYPLKAQIFRISSDGSYCITSQEGAVYLANSSMEYKGVLHAGSLAYSDFAFSDDGSTIYAATSNRKSNQIGSYPALTRDDEILTKGYPVFIIRDDQKIIAVSKSSENSINTGVEVIQL